MIRVHICILLALLCIAATRCGEPRKPSPSMFVFNGLCDASAAIGVDDRHFVVASDEDSKLRLYDVHAPGPPIQTFDLSGFLELDLNHPETDIEAAANLNGLVYWITSHGRNVDGKTRESRERLFATRIERTTKGFNLVPVGRPCKTLLEAMATEPRLRRLGLAAAAAKAPKAAGGLNIEGLAPTPDGSLLIGFRNPVPDRLALVIPLLNPGEVIAGGKPQFGDPVQVDLSGLGIRDMIWLKGGYFIIGGPTKGKPEGRVFKWDGVSKVATQVARAKRQQFNPEAFVVFNDVVGYRVMLLSDDGARRIDGCECKKLADETQRQFRAMWVDLWTD